MGQDLEPGLYIVATPIGNLGDITLRAVEVLGGVAAVACEDTRVTGKLLHHLGLKKRMIRYNDHAGEADRERLLALMAEVPVALVSDAGTPLISDPGYRLVRAARERGIAVTSLPGIGPRFGKLLEKLCGPSVVSLLWHLPAGLVDRSAEPDLDDAVEGTIITAVVKPLAHMPPNNPRQPYRVSCVNDTGELDLVFFKAQADYLKKILPVGELRVVSGRIERYGRTPNMVHPDYILPVSRRDETPRFEPVYPLTAGLPPKVVVKAVRAALEHLPDPAEWADAHLVKRHGWPDWDDAVRAVHNPKSHGDLDPASPARQRIAYDELLANQLALALTRQHNRRLPGRPSVGNGSLRDKVLKALPYRLTGAQTMAVAEIEGDMAGSHRMLRLLQGDVGSGKTVVALMAMLIAVEAGGQAALLAPTDILARQHLATLRPLCAAAGVNIVLLTGREKGKSRDVILKDLADGTLKMVVGTHALVQSDIAFDDLRLAVVDEQHRFGVQQRIALAEKGKGVDLLVMTATPIPRTLMLTAYGDIDVSRLTEKPAGRQPIDTRVLPVERQEEIGWPGLDEVRLAGAAEHHPGDQRHSRGAGGEQQAQADAQRNPRGGAHGARSSST